MFARGVIFLQLGVVQIILLPAMPEKLYEEFINSPCGALSIILRTVIVRKKIFYLLDLSIVALAPFVAVVLRNNFSPPVQGLLNVLPYAVIGLCVFAVVFVVAGVQRGIWRYVSLPDVNRIIVATGIAVLVTLAVMFSLNRLDNVARSVPLMQWVLVVAGMVSARIVARLFFARKSVRRDREGGPSREHVLVVGLNQVAELYLRCVSSLASGNMVVAGLLDESPLMKGRRLHGHKVLGQPRELSGVLALLNIHGVSVKRVVITTPFQELTRSSRDELLKLERSGVVKLDMFEERLGFVGHAGADEAVSEPGNKLDLGADSLVCGYRDCPVGNRYSLIKPVVDFVGSLVLMVIFLPVTLVVSLLVALDVGLPLTFWQERPGREGFPFRVYKFRTMKSAHDAMGVRIPDEQRQSGVGRFLRRSRFDELPQLLNILVGEMSFVGPRPLLPVDLPQSRPDILKIRNCVRPGLTGWAQINGGKMVSIEDKAVLDMWYVRNMSLKLDLKIIIGTIDMVIRGERPNEEAVRVAYRDLGLTRGQVFDRSGDAGDLGEVVKVGNMVVLHKVAKTA